MKSRLHLVLGVLLLVFALFLVARNAAPVGATNLPEFIVPKAAHLHFDASRYLNDCDSVSAMTVITSGQGHYKQVCRVARGIGPFA